MPAVARGGDAITTGHVAPCDTVSTIMTDVTTGDTNMVFANGIGIACIDDIITPHTMNNPSPPPLCIPHVGAVVNTGSGSVFIGGIAVSRVGDSADSGKITAGSETVNAG